MQWELIEAIKSKETNTITYQAALTSKHCKWKTSLAYLQDLISILLTYIDNHYAFQSGCKYFKSLYVLVSSTYCVLQIVQKFYNCET